MKKHNFGIAPAVIALIASLVIQGIKLGYTYYQSVMMAREQAELTRQLAEDEIVAISSALSQQTGISFSEWYNIIKLSYVPQPPVIIPEPKPKNDWTMYIVFGVLGVLILTRR
jgi:hypothetical protein